MAITLLHGSHSQSAKAQQSASEAAPPTAADGSASDDLLTRTSWTDAHVALVQIKKVIHLGLICIGDFGYEIDGEMSATQIIGCCVGDEDISRPLQVGQSPPEGTSHLIGRPRLVFSLAAARGLPSIFSSK
jgi:hypothetical protein